MLLFTKIAFAHAHLSHPSNTHHTHTHHTHTSHTHTHTHTHTVVDCGLAEIGFGVEESCTGTRAGDQCQFWCVGCGRGVARDDGVVVAPIPTAESE